MPRAVLDKMAAVQMLDVHFPTSDDRTSILSRYTDLSRQHKVLLRQPNLAVSSTTSLQNHRRQLHRTLPQSVM